MKNIKVLGIDLAKNVFQIHGTDLKGKCVLRKRLSRPKLVEFISNLTPCLIGIEACSGSHYWARVFTNMGHEVKIMSPQFVKPYVRSNKNDRNDARGIAEAVMRPDMKFVPIKSTEQQDDLLIHRARELAIKQRTAQVNQIRGLLAEYGIIIPKGIQQVATLPDLLRAHEEHLSVRARKIFMQLYQQFRRYDRQVDVYDHQLKGMAQADVRCQAVMKIDGVGPITATAVVATMGNANVFKNGREFSAWLGLVPKQHSSGNKIRLSGISKRGDRYMRKLLIHGARSVVKTCDKKSDRKNVWVADKKKRRGYNRAVVAVANKNARVIWAILATGECYRQPERAEKMAA
jgi:transposase